MTGRIARSGIAVLVLCGALLATPTSAQQPSVADAEAFLKDKLLSQMMGLPQNGTVTIEEVDFKDCSMGLSSQNRFFMVDVNLRKADFDALDSAGVTTEIIIESGVTVYRNRLRLQPQDSSTINLEFVTVSLGSRVMSALNVLHNACHTGSGYQF